MKHQKLINDLSKNLEAVTPLPGRWQRTASLAFGTLIAVLFVFVFFSIRPDLKSTMTTGQFILGAVLCATGWWVGAYSLSLFQTPATQEKKYLFWSVGIFTILCLTYVFLGITRGEPGSFESGMSVGGAHCSLDVIFLSLLPGIFLFLRLKKGAPTQTTLSGFNIGLCCALLSAFFLQFSCPSQASSHLLIWHMMIPAIILSGLGAALGRKVLKW